MWVFLVKLILRNRYINLISVIFFTLIISFFAFRAELSYEYAHMLPEKDPEHQIYLSFKETFKEEGNIFFVGVVTEKMKEVEFFTKWHKLSGELKDKYGVKDIFSFSNIFYLHKNTDKKKFELKRVFEKDNISLTQQEYDSLYNKIIKLRFYDNFLFSSEKNIHLLLIWIEEHVLNSAERISCVLNIRDHIYSFAEENDIKVHFSGLPYIRTMISLKIRQELTLFLILSAIVSMLILFFFFRSFRAVILPIVIVGIGVLWSLGLMVIMGYKITVLTGILPPILIIIGIENCVYLLTHYHIEIIKHGGIGRALARVIQRVGYATLLTNVTTAVGFGAFVVTANEILVEFAIIASVSIILMFIFSIILIPVLYSFFPAPQKRHTKHLDRNLTNKLYETFYHIITNHRKKVFTFTSLLFILGIIGIFMLKQKGTMVDDIPHKDPLYTDLMFFEENLGGVLPYEISIDTRKKNGLLDIRNINKIEELQNILCSYKEIGKPLSYVEIIKFARQAFYNNNPDKFGIPSRHERNFIFSYLPKFDTTNTFELLRAFTDTNMQIARVSARLKNINTKEIAQINDNIRIKTDSIFPPENYDIEITGTAVVFHKGSSYLVKNLIWSLIVAMFVISIFLYLLFNSFRMVLIAMVSNILPQVMTAALMGFLQIDIKPSTIIIYSIALGISVDAAIHLLSRYRQQLIITNLNVKKSLQNALKETNIGMMYSGIILILGFAVFTLSKFGGTQSLGFLVAFTLAVAMFSNLILLPSLILKFEKSITAKSFAKKTIFDIIDEKNVPHKNNNNNTL